MFINIITFSHAPATQWTWCWSQYPRLSQCPANRQSEDVESLPGPHLIVAAGQHGLVEAAPGDAGDLTRADHLSGGVVDVHHVLQHIFEKPFFSN